MCIKLNFNLFSWREGAATIFDEGTRRIILLFVMAFAVTRARKLAHKWDTVCYFALVKSAYYRPHSPTEYPYNHYISASSLMC